MPRFLAALLLLALPLRADRVQVVVAIRDDVRAASLRPVREGVIASIAGATRVERWGEGPAFSVEIERSGIEALSRDPRVKAVAIDEGGGAALLESVPLVGGDLAAALGFDGTGATVAVIDSGIESTHPALAGAVADEQCFCENPDGTGCCKGGGAASDGSGSAADDNGHGTHVAGIVASNGTSPAPPGLAPAARLVAVKVLNAEAKFRSFTEIYRALEWVATSHPEVRVINMSLGSFALYSPEECAANAIALGLTPIVELLRSRGVVITVASGNQGSTTSMTLPACMDGVLAVGAVYDAPGDYDTICSVTGAAADQVACFTNSNATLDLLAPGAPIVSAWRRGLARPLHGTSMAAPHVAAIAAMMLQASGGALTVEQIEQILTATGKPVLDSRTGLTTPRVDAAAALSATPRPIRRRGARH